MNLRTRGRLPAPARRRPDAAPTDRGRVAAAPDRATKSREDMGVQMRALLRPSVLAASLAVLLGAGAFWAAGQDQAGVRKAQDKQIADTLRVVINKGADYFNENKDFNGCARLFEGALL